MSKLTLHKGATRWVLCTKRYAIKFPSLESWTHFLHGLLANLQERLWSKTVWKSVRYSRGVLTADASSHDNYVAYGHLLPVLYADFLGMFLIMPRIFTPPIGITEDMLREICTYDKVTFPSDLKKENFGIHRGKIYCFDYGS